MENIIRKIKYSGIGKRDKHLSLRGFMREVVLEVSSKE